MRQFFLFITIFFAMQAGAQQTNNHFYHTDSTTAKAEKIWEVWTDVANWKAWDKGLKEATMESDFVVGKLQRHVACRFSRNQTYCREK